MIRDAGISVPALPAPDLYLMGGGDTRNVRRGLAPVRRLAEAGVNVAVSTNNVQSRFTPWATPISSAWPTCSPPPPTSAPWRT